MKVFRGVAFLMAVAAFAAVSCGCGAVVDGADRRLALPAGLPADVPLPAGAHLRSARDLGDKGLTLVFETDEPVSGVEERLRSRLAAGGWTLLSDVAVGGAVYYSYRNRGRSVALGISRTGGVTVVGLAYHQPVPAGEGVRG